MYDHSKQRPGQLSEGRAFLSQKERPRSERCLECRRPERPVWLKGGERAGAEMAGEARGWKLCRRWSLGFYTKHDEKIFWQQRRDTS